LSFYFLSLFVLGSFDYRQNIVDLEEALPPWATTLEFLPPCPTTPEI
jgi:hypothetical protein